MASYVKRSPPIRSQNQAPASLFSRQEIAEQLAEVLAGTYTLLLKTHACHCNAAGGFLPLHKLTEHHYKNLAAATDALAERIRALGFRTPDCLGRMRPQSDVQEERTFRSAGAMARILIRDHEIMARRVREAAAAADHVDDIATADLLALRLNFHEMAIWMLSGAALHESRPRPGTAGR